MSKERNLTDRWPYQKKSEGLPWFSNWTQIWVTEDPEKTMFVTNYPLLELNTHVTFKTLQIASVIGGCIVNPIVYYSKLYAVPESKRTVNTPNVVRAVARKFSNRIFYLGALAGPIVTLAYTNYKGMSHADIQAACIRLRYNKAQLWCDRTTFAFGFAGWYMIRFPGAVIGVNIGLLYSYLWRRLKYDHRSAIFLDRYTTLPQQLFDQLFAADNVRAAGCPLFTDDDRTTVLQTQ